MTWLYECQCNRDWWLLRFRWFWLSSKKIKERFTLYGSSYWTWEECLWLNCYWVSVLTASSGWTPCSRRESYWELYYFAFSARIFILVCFSSLFPMPSISREVWKEEIIVLRLILFKFKFYFSFIHKIFGQFNCNKHFLIPINTLYNECRKTIMIIKTQQTKTN